jgi:3-oxoacyl-[acyl-carrier protein] reductase
VVLAYASPSSDAKINTLKTKIESLPHGPVAYPVRADLGSIEGAGQIISTLLEWTGNDLHLDILVNNAGLERVKSLAEISIDDYDAVYNLNVRGIILLTQAALPYLGAGARIVNLGSVGARAGFQSLSLYCSSKAALEGLTRCWAAELGGNGTTVNCVNPGPVQSEMLDNIPKEIVDMQKAQTPIQNRLGTIQEVANIVAGLAGRDGAWVTGQVISASGVSHNPKTVYKCCYLHTYLIAIPFE